MILGAYQWIDLAGWIMDRLGIVPPVWLIRCVLVALLVVGLAVVLVWGRRRPEGRQLDETASPTKQGEE